MHKPDMLIDAALIKSTITKLKNEEDYTLLLDITAVDNSEFPEATPSRFSVIYILRTSDFKSILQLKLL